MKKLIFITVVLLLFILTKVEAQIENFKINDQITLNKIYLGVLSASDASVDSLYVSQYVGLRAGAMAEWSISDWFSLGGLSTYQDVGSDSWGIAQAWVTFYPVKGLSIKAGNMGTLSTEHRPLPPTAAGQFETWAESQIPGGALNVKAKYEGNMFQIGMGIAVRENKAEYHSMLGFKKLIKVSAWYSKCNGEWGFAGTMDSKIIYNTLVVKKDIIANIIIIHLPGDLDLYSDNGYNFKIKDLVRSETGLLKNFKSKYISGLIGIAYAYETKAVRGFLFVHL